MTPILAIILAAAAKAGAPVVKAIVQKHAGPLAGTLAGSVIDQVAAKVGVPAEELAQADPTAIESAVRTVEAETPEMPEAAEADLAWLNEELREMKRPQVAILDEFNSRLADHGIGPISKGGFSRYSVKKARQWREYDERLRLSKALCESMGPDGADTMAIAVAERIKMAADELLSRGDLTPKEIGALANANRAAVTAQRHATELRRSLESEQKRKLEATLEAVEDGIARDKGAKLDAPAVLKIIRDAYGIGS